MARKKHVKKECVDSSETGFKREPYARIVSKLLPIFLASYLCYLLLAEIQIFRDYIAVVHPVFLVWGYSLFLWEIIFHSRIALKIPGWKRAVLFFLISIITIILNWTANLGTQVKAMMLHVETVLIVYGLAYIYIRRNRSIDTIRRLLQPTIYLNFFFGLISLTMFLFRNSFQQSVLGKRQHIGLYEAIYGNKKTILLYGLYNDTNHSALIFLSACFISIAFYLISRSNKALHRQRLFYLVNSVVVFLCFVLANSRGAYLTLLVVAVILFGVVVYNWNTRRKANTCKTARLLNTVLCSMLAVALTIGLVFIVQVASQAYINLGPRTSSTNNEDDEDEAVSFHKDGNILQSGRVVLWRDGLKLFVRHPLLGIGADNRGYYAQRELPSDNSLYHNKALHNSYLELLVSNGILGFMCYAYFFLPLFSKYFSAMLKLRFPYLINEALLFAALMTVLFGCFFISDLFSSSSFLYALVMILLAYGVQLPGLTKEMYSRIDSDRSLTRQLQN